MSIILAGVSHHRTPLEVRERLHFSQSSMRECLDRLARYNGLKERVILSTCNRVEIYSYAESFESGVRAIHDFLVETGDVDPEELRTHLYIHGGEQAMRHLFFVASSLDSMVIGEPQILGQVREAYRIAHETGHAGKALSDLFSRAFRVAKKVREQTDIARNPVSVSSVAVDLAKKIFGTLERRSVLLLGAGEMGEAAARHLIGYGASPLSVATRTFSRAQELALKLGGRAAKFGDLPREMALADIVIASTGAPHIVVSQGMVASALEMRHDAPIFLIDIAVPRDVDPKANDLENVYLYDIDDLQAVIAANLKGRQEEMHQARSIVELELESYQRRRKAEGLSRAFASVRIEAEAHRQRELNKTLSKFSDLGEKERQGMDAMTRALVNKLLHRPFAVLREMANEDVTEESLALVRRLFGVEPDTMERGSSEPGTRE